MTWRENGAARLAQWRAENPEAVAEIARQKRLERGREARRQRLAKALANDPALELYRAEKQRRRSA